MRQSQLSLLGNVPSLPLTCLMCGGPIRSRRCRRCQSDTPTFGGPAHRRWTKGISAVLRGRLKDAGLSDLWFETWRALLEDSPLPPETAPLVGDLAALPFSLARYQAKLNRAVMAANLLYVMTDVVREPGDKTDPKQDLAAIIADRVWSQRERLARGEGEEVAEAEIMLEAQVEFYARKTLARRLRGGVLEAAVRARVTAIMVPYRGMFEATPLDGPTRIVVVPCTRISATAQEVADHEAEALQEVQAASEEAGKRYTVSGQ